MKKTLLVLLLIFPTVLVAKECDYSREVELSELASNVTYETNYNKEKNNYDVTIYNIVDSLYITYLNEYYYAKDGVATINGIKEGSSLSVIIKSSEETCYPSLITLYITIPYFNRFYKSEYCQNYEDQISICSSEFLPYKITKKILNDAINNYDKGIENKEEEKEEAKVSLIQKVVNFTRKWGIKILLVIISTILTILPFNVKFRKIKHGI